LPVGVVEKLRELDMSTEPITKPRSDPEPTYLTIGSAQIVFDKGPTHIGRTNLLGFATGFDNQGFTVAEANALGGKLNKQITAAITRRTGLPCESTAVRTSSGSIRIDIRGIKLKLTGWSEEIVSHYIGAGLIALILSVGSCDLSSVVEGHPELEGEAKQIIRDIDEVIETEARRFAARNNLRIKKRVFKADKPKGKGPKSWK
jgi:hypothetical protein